MKRAGWPTLPARTMRIPSTSSCWAPATEGLARVDAELAEATYKSQMARAVRAVAEDDLSEARTAYQAALEARPDSTDAREGLAHVERVGRSRRIAHHRRQAEMAERGENWGRAAEHYRAVLDLDGWWGLGVAGYAAGMLVSTWAMLVNTHFEKTVRIQHDRGHRVVDRGPYAVVRHPGYVGALLACPLATPLLLGARWAWIPALASTAMLVLRTALEDRLLRRELAGYAAYAARVRHRLLPGLW